MTALNLAVQKGRRSAFLIMDAAFTNLDGTVRSFGSKIIRFERFPAAIGISGNIDVIRLGHLIWEAQPRNLRSLLQMLPGCLQKEIGLIASEHSIRSDQATGTVAVAAYSQREKRPAGYVMSSSERISAQLGGAFPFEVVETTLFRSGATPEAELIGRPCTLDDYMTFHPDQDAFALVAAQRTKTEEILDHGDGIKPAYRIGGGVQLATVTRHGVKIAYCGEFPDKVGELIAPIVSA